MDFTLIFACLLAIVSPSLQLDDRPRIFKDRRLGDRDLPGARLSGGLDIVGPFGGRLSAFLKGVLGGRAGPFRRDRHAKLEGGIMGRTPITDLAAAAKGKIGGSWGRSRDGVRGELSGGLESRAGNIFGEIFRGKLEGNIRGGADVSLPIVSRALRVREGFGGIGNECLSPLPSACFTTAQDINSACKFIYDPSVVACVEAHVYLRCAAPGQGFTIFDDIRECDLYCH